MNAIKLTLLGSILLTACTPRPTTMDGTSSYYPNRTAKAEAITPGSTTTTTAETFSATGNNKNVDKKQASETVAETKGNTAETAKIAATSSASAISSWEISGAMAARSKNKGWNASVNWLQRGIGHYQIRLFGPLGSGTVLINKKGGLVTLRDGPKTASSSNAEELLKKQTGIRLPVNNLYYWVRGLPAPGHVQSAKRDSANHLLVLKQSGYVIDYGQYTSVGKTVLPSVIRLQGNGVFIKLVIKRWRI
ncbi:lipoprotein insertase outer membrane protein LolB [Legionella jamestowniensis]|uniref:Outer-membrane lipoprotein LolB n=1 Tax=Legionella jamestowniensis TaxID=455 RepID=A0A0W0UHP5_9GAMM|nr:lipoprotein insertase outer membrane protein LolB [Legionella jamestowniensis]KTD07409.1 molecular chaperone LolB [Legionella jamestowniensis]SFL93371.1 outer membrane lipoprotein LolB [Legionella jamestowniensis DSM 19215]